MNIKSASLKIRNRSQAHCLQPGSGQNSRNETERSSLREAEPKEAGGARIQANHLLAQWLDVHYHHYHEDQES